MERRDARPCEQPRAQRTTATAATATVPPLAMRVAVISDIHSNLHALEAVLADIDTEAPDEIWCLGDVVGYGPCPNECVRRDRASARRSRLCGNHDLAVDRRARRRGLLAATPATAARWTRTVLREPQADWLRALEPLAERAGAQLFHGSPRDPGVGVRPERGGRARVPRADDRADRARRAQPHRARARLGRRRARRRARARRARRSSSASAAGSSIPDRSGSRATATRGPHGS